MVSKFRKLPLKSILLNFKLLTFSIRDKKAILLFLLKKQTTHCTKLWLIKRVVISCKIWFDTSMLDKSVFEESEMDRIGKKGEKLSR